MRFERSYFGAKSSNIGDAGDDFWSFVMELDLV
jgi:hypothetical protein